MCPRGLKKAIDVGPSVSVGLKKATINWCKNFPRVSPACSGVKASHELLKGVVK